MALQMEPASVTLMDCLMESALASQWASPKVKLKESALAIQNVSLKARSMALLSEQHCSG
jgi:hypothetical protein